VVRPFKLAGDAASTRRPATPFATPEDPPATRLPPAALKPRRVAVVSAVAGKPRPRGLDPPSRAALPAPLVKTPPPHSRWTARPPASSLEGPGLGGRASYAIDGEHGTTRWSRIQAPQWWRVDLGARRADQRGSGGLGERPRNGVPGGAVRKRSDGTTWETVTAPATARAGGPFHVKRSRSFGPVVRMYGTSASNATATR